jgi:hypothetical protein
MFGICDNCENFIACEDGEVSCELGHEIIKDRQECEDYLDYSDVSGEGPWSLD